MPTPSHPAPARQYVFRTRRDRQRIAQRLAAGMGAAEVAAVERCDPEEIGTLLGDSSFQRLVEAYEELLSASPEERRSRLVALAAEILQQEVMAGNTFACAFMLHLHEQGRFITLATSIDRQITGVQTAGTITGEATKTAGGNQVTVKNPLAYEVGKLIQLPGVSGNLRITAINSFTLTLSATVAPALTDTTVAFPLQIKLDSTPGVTQTGATMANRQPSFQALPTP